MITQNVLLLEGTFVSKYVGNLYNSVLGNEEGMMHGDNYFCELDLIENVEQNKVNFDAFLCKYSSTLFYVMFLFYPTARDPLIWQILFRLLLLF